MDATHSRDNKDLADLKTEAEALLVEIRRRLGSESPAVTARGTQDLTAEARAAAAELPLVDRAAELLRTRPISIDDLAQALRVPVGRLSAAIRPLRKRLWNAGSATEPRWFLPPPEDASPEEFAAAVRGLVRLRPMTTAELHRATQTAGSKRVWHALLRLKDAPGSRLVRQVDRGKHRWFWLDESAQGAPLQEGVRRASAH